MRQPPRFELGDTREFSAAYSANPSIAPRFEVWGSSGSSVLVFSVGATASGNGLYFVNYHLPTSVGLYEYRWTASFTLLDGPVIFGGLFEMVRNASWG